MTPVSTYDSARYARGKLRDPRHLRRIRAWVAPQPGERVLEVGAGIGQLVAPLRADGVDAVGVDVNPQAVRHALTDAVEVAAADALGFPDAAFDAVLSFHVIEHVPDLGAVLTEMARVLRPGGRLLLVYPAEPVRGLYAVPGAVLLHGNPLRARDLHVRSLTPARLRRAVGDAGVGLAHKRSHLSLLGCPQFESLFRRLPERAGAGAGDR